MHRALVSIAIACAASGSAAAQPGQTAPPAQPPPAQPPPPPPGWGAQPPSIDAAPGYHLLSDEERDLLARGEISDGAHVGGGVIGTFFGFGLGHLVQGRFGDKGWIFMGGEVVSVAFLSIGLSQCLGDFWSSDGESTCDQNPAYLVGLVGALGFRIWELVDVWAGPPAHNARVRAIRVKAGLPPYGLFVSPSLGRGDGGGVAGLTLRF